jgi:uncharacterized protein involved in exopolysaccharide biosynthesis
MAGMMDEPALRDARAASSHDEVSLRELYLVLRRRALAIVAVALIAGVAAYAVVATRPSVFLAEATTVVARAPIEVGGTGLRFRPEVDVTFDTYQTLAFTRAVLEEVLPFHEAVDVGGLRNALRLERVAGPPNQAPGLLAVAHHVRSEDAAQAAAAASAWAGATIATTRRLLLENLDVVETITGTGLTAARADLEAAEADLEAFRASSGIESLRALLGVGTLGTPGSLELAIAETEAALRVNRLAATQRAAELTSLRARGEAGDGALEVVLVATPEVLLSVEGAIASLEVRAAALAAEEEALTATLADLRGRRAEAAAALAEATVGLARRERAAAAPLELLTSLTAIEPSVAFVAQIAPAGARVLSEAAVPSAPEPRRSMAVTLLVAVVAGLVAAVVVLLAEAVSEPRADRPTRSARATRSVGSGATHR